MFQEMCDLDVDVADGLKCPDVVIWIWDGFSGADEAFVIELHQKQRWFGARENVWSLCSWHIMATPRSRTGLLIHLAGGILEVNNNK